MSAPDTTPRPLPPIGQTRYARDIRTGWHVYLYDGGWHLVLGADASGGGCIEITVRVGLHGEDMIEFARSQPVATRTPEEQIQWVEARRVADSGRRGYGPVSELHLSQQWDAALAETREWMRR